MATFRSSNLDRTMYRTKCRQKPQSICCKICLSLRSSIECFKGLEVTKLGTLIEAADVRLCTSKLIQVPSFGLHIILL